MNHDIDEASKLGSLEQTIAALAKFDRFYHIRVLLLLAFVVAAVLTASTYYAWHAVRLSQEAREWTAVALARKEQLARTTPVLAVSRDRSFAVSASGWLLDAKGEPIRRYAHETKFAVFSPDSLEVFIQPAESDGTPVVLVLKPGAPIASKISYQFAKGSSFTFAAFRPDGRILTLIVASAGLGVLDLSQGTFKVRPTVKSPLTFGAYSPDGQKFIIRSSGGDISLVSFPPTRSSNIALKYYGTTHRDVNLTGAAFSSDGKEVLLLFGDASAWVWDLRTKRIREEFAGLTSTK